MASRLKVHIVTHDDMDGFLWGVLEGWLVSGLIPHQIEARICGPNTYLDPAPDFWETLPDADAILFCVTSGPATNLERACDVIEKHGLWGRVVHHDYQHNLELRATRAAKRAAKVLIAKRLKYLRCCADWPNAEWLPRTGLQERILRYAPALPWPLWKDLPAAAVYHTGMQTQAHRLPWMRIVEQTLPGSVVGAIPRQDSLLPARIRRACGARHVPAYFEQVSRARIGVYLMGGCVLGHQFWEFGALRCAIVAMHPTLHPLAEEDTQEWEHFEQPLVEGDDFLYFDSAVDLREKLRWMNAHPAACEQMAENVWNKLQTYRSAARSSYIYRLLRKVAR